MAYYGHPIGHAFAARKISFAPTPYPGDIELIPNYFDIKKPPGQLPEIMGLGRHDPLPVYVKQLKNKSEMINNEMKRVAIKWVKGKHSQRKRLEAVYSGVTPKVATIYYLDDVLRNIYRFFNVDADAIWNRRGDGGEACHGQSVLLRAMLLASGCFEPYEVKFNVKWGHSIPHTYLKVYLRDEKKWVFADPIRQDYVRGAGKDPTKALYKHM